MAKEEAAKAPAGKADKKEPDAKGAPAPAVAGKEAGGHGAAGGGGGGLLTKTPVLLGGVMIIEAVVLFAAFKFLGSGAPKVAAGAELATSETKLPGQEAADPANKNVEIPVVDFRAPNKQSGRTFLYDVSIVAVAKQPVADRVTGILKDSDALVKDRIRTIIATLDPEKLGGGTEPGLETLRRQVKYQLDEIVGQGMIDEVLVPRCIPFRTDF